jgi:hypothetical protein
MISVDDYAVDLLDVFCEFIFEGSDDEMETAICEGLLRNYDEVSAASRAFPEELLDVGSGVCLFENSSEDICFCLAWAAAIVYCGDEVSVKFDGLSGRAHAGCHLRTGSAVVNKWVRDFESRIRSPCCVL